MSDSEAGKMSKSAEREQSNYDTDAKMRILKISKQLLTICSEIKDDGELLITNLLDMRKSVNIANITGATISLGIGTPLFATGVILEAASLGLLSPIALPLIIAGTAVAAAGAVTGAGANIAEHFLTDSHMEDMKAKLAQFSTLAKQMQLEQMLINLRAQERLYSLALDSATLGGTMALASLQIVAKIALQSMDDIVVGAVPISRSLGTFAAKFGGSTANIALRAVAGAAAIALNAAFDIYTITITAKNLAKGNVTPTVDKLRAQIAMIDKYQLNIQDTYEALLGDSLCDVDLLSCMICFTSLSRCGYKCFKCPNRCAAIVCRSCAVTWLETKGASQCPFCQHKWNMVEDGQEMDFQKLCAALNSKNE